MCFSLRFFYYYLFLIFQLKNYEELIKLDQINIIKVLEIVELPEGPIFVQELLDCDLLEYCCKEPYVGYDNLVALFLQMATALDFLKVFYIDQFFYSIQYIQTKVDPSRSIYLRNILKVTFH